MAYFPFYVDLNNKKALIIGGGIVAYRKIEKLKPFGIKLTVISPLFNKKIKEDNDLILLNREYKEGDEEGYDFVIASTDNKDVNKTISNRCKERNILVNVVDNPSLCTFIFPSLIKNGKLTIGISTSGSSPTAAIELKNMINSLIPENFDSILDFLYETRNEIKETVKTEKERHEILKELFYQCIDKKRPLTSEECNDKKEVKDE